ncbi:hypothetical protein [Anaerocolumna sp.]|nr:hypothetical protein [Anaerocolumna sp.]
MLKENIERKVAAKDSFSNLWQYHICRKVPHIQTDVICKWV